MVYGENDIKVGWTLGVICLTVVYFDQMMGASLTFAGRERERERRSASASDSAGLKNNFNMLQTIDRHRKRL